MKLTITSLVPKIGQISITLNGSGCCFYLMPSKIVLNVTRKMLYCRWASLSEQHTVGLSAVTVCVALAAVFVLNSSCVDVASVVIGAGVLSRILSLGGGCIKRCLGRSGGMLLLMWQVW